MRNLSVVAKVWVMGLAFALVASSALAQEGGQRRQRGGEGGQRRQRGGQDGQQRRGGSGFQFGGRGGSFSFGGRSGGSVSLASLLRAEDVQGEIKLEGDQKETVDAALEAYRDETRGLFPQGVDFRSMSEEDRAKMMEEVNAKREKLDSSTDEIIIALLDEGQIKRLKEIRVQSLGSRALQDKKVAAALKLSDEQTKKIADVMAAQADKQRAMFEEMRSAFSGGRGGSGRPGRPGGEEGGAGRPGRPGGEGGAGRPGGGRPGGEGGAGRPGGGRGGSSAFGDIQAKMQEMRDATDKSLMAVLSDAQKKQFEEMKGKPFERERRSRGGSFGGGRGGSGRPQRPGGGDSGRPQRPGDRP